MSLNPLFENVTLKNRLGQFCRIDIFRVTLNGRNYIFIATPTSQASSLVWKNAEHFAFQLRERFELDPKQWELIEVRRDGGTENLYRWRFDWAGNAPFSARREEIVSVGQRTMLLNCMMPFTSAAVATA